MLKAKVSIPLACIGVAPVIEREAERGAGDTCGYCAVAASGPVSWQSPCFVWQPQSPPPRFHGGR